MFPCSELCGAVPGLKLDTLKWERVWSMKPCMVPVSLNMYWYTSRGIKSDVKEITKAWKGKTTDRERVRRTSDICHNNASMARVLSITSLGAK